MHQKEAATSKAITIRTDAATYERLEALARASSRSRNFLANEALKAYLSREGGQPSADVPVVVSAEDLIGDFWPEDDSEAFLAYLEDERSASLEADRTRAL